MALFHFFSEQSLLAKWAFEMTIRKKEGGREIELNKGSAVLY